MSFWFEALMTVFVTYASSAVVLKCDICVNKMEIVRLKERESVNTAVHTLVPEGPGASDIKGATQVMTISHTEMVTFL